MSFTLFSAPNVPRGCVVVVRGEDVIFAGTLEDCLKTDRNDDERVDIFMHPDAAADCADCADQRKRRLN